MRIGALLLAPLALAAAMPAGAQTGEAAIRATVAGWYAELAKKEAGRTDPFTAPGFIDASPHTRPIATGSAAASPVAYTSLPATALEFRYEVLNVQTDARFAKVRVWERGYFYAWAAQKTYELAASTLFVLERQDDGRWLILAHESHSEGIPPNRITSPMPDLRARFYATEGKGRDPAKDAEAAKNF